MTACSSLPEGAHTFDCIKVSFLVLCSWQTLNPLQQSLESPEITPHFLPFWDTPAEGTGKRGAWLPHKRPTRGSAAAFCVICSWTYIMGSLHPQFPPVRSYFRPPFKSQQLGAACFGPGPAPSCFCMFKIFFFLIARLSTIKP